MCVSKEDFATVKNDVKHISKSIDKLVKQAEHVEERLDELPNAFITRREFEVFKWVIGISIPLVTGIILLLIERAV